MMCWGSDSSPIVSLRRNETMGEESDPIRIILTHSLLPIVDRLGIVVDDLGMEPRSWASRPISSRARSTC
jgi:hypothetical protein